MLIAVLALSILAIVERPQDSKPAGLDKVNFTLICTGLLINSIALAAILFRLASYGLTPNRLAVLGSNILVFSHAVLIWKAYFSFLRDRGSMTSIHSEVARFLPAYSIWTCVVTFIFPLAFGFR